MRHSFRNWFGAFDLVGELRVDSEGPAGAVESGKTPPPQPWLAVYIESAGAVIERDPAVFAYRLIE